MFGFYLFSLCSHTWFLLILGRFEDLWSYRLAWWPIRQQPGSLRRETYSETGRRFFFSTPALLYPPHANLSVMSIPSGSPEREGSGGAPPQLECPSSPPGMDPDPSSNGSPVLSPDSSSHDAVLSAPAASPADSENLSPDELELLAKLEEQNR